MKSQNDLSDFEGFEWDEGNIKHIIKHDIGPKECEEIFVNKPFLLSEDKEHSQTEKRFQVLGRTNGGRLIFLAFTIRNKKIRAVTARNQNKKERIIFAHTGGE